MIENGTQTLCESVHETLLEKANKGQKRMNISYSDTAARTQIPQRAPNAGSRSLFAAGSQSDEKRRTNDDRGRVS